MANGLAERVSQNAAAQTKDQGKPSLRQLIEQMRPEIARALPKHMDPDRVARIAITLIGGNANLAACTSESFLGALMTASQLGLEPGPLGEAYLVPYGRTCTFIPGYKGLIKLAWNSGQMKHIDAQAVRENDDFDYAYGLEPYLTHKPARRNRGQVTDVYAVATFLNGGSAFVVMSVEDVEEIRKRSKAANNGPWVTDWDAMAKKTAIRQLAKFLPLSTELRDFHTAAALDGSARTDFTNSLEEQVPSWVEGQVVGDEPDTADDQAPAAELSSTPDHAADVAADDQIKAIHSLLSRCKVGDRGQRLDIIGKVVGHPVVTSNDLTGAEAVTVLDLLARVVADKDPARALDAVLAELADADQTGGES